MRQRACHRCAKPLPLGRRYCLSCSPTPRAGGYVRRAQRAAALLRAGYRCQVPDCETRDGLEVHHIIPLAQRGADDLTNLVVLCPDHHASAVPRGVL